MLLFIPLHTCVRLHRSIECSKERVGPDIAYVVGLPLFLILSFGMLLKPKEDYEP